MAKMFLFVGVFLVVGVASAFLGALGYVTIKAIQQLLAVYQPWVAWLVWGLGSVWVVGASIGIARWASRKRSPAQPVTERQVIMLTPTEVTQLFDTWQAKLPASTEQGGARLWNPSGASFERSAARAARQIHRRKAA